MDDKFSCGCLWTKHGEISTFKFCPKHAAAPDMFEALGFYAAGGKDHGLRAQAALELVGDSDETKLPISDTPEDDPFYEWPEEH